MRHPTRRGAAALLLATVALAAAVLSSATCASILGFEGDYYVDAGSGLCKSGCGLGELCDAGVCTCRPGLVPCGDRCVDENTDGQNCGACGVACDGGQACFAAECHAGTCPGSTTACDCSDAMTSPCSCVDVMSAPLNCGDCHVPCDTAEVCAGGHCASN
jgi:hypothetical protein